MLLADPAPQHPPVRRLRERLDTFYRTTTAYTAFHETVERSEQYSLWLPMLRALASARAPVRVLELGAGRSGFSSFVKEHGLPALVDVQDVTDTNADYLRSVANQVFVGDISAIPGPYDFIFHSYVFEHVATPRDFLEHVDRLLAPGGVHAIVCPRYDMPGYVCPSMRHHGKARQLLHSAALTARRLSTAAGGREGFFVNDDPSMFHGPWFRDADAIHLVSRFDVVRWHKARRYAVTPLRPAASGLVAHVIARHLTLNVMCRKPA